MILWSRDQKNLNNIFSSLQDLWPLNLTGFWPQGGGSARKCLGRHEPTQVGFTFRVLLSIRVLFWIYTPYSSVPLRIISWSLEIEMQIWQHMFAQNNAMTDIDTQAVKKLRKNKFCFNFFCRYDFWRTTSVS